MIEVSWFELGAIAAVTLGLVLSTICYAYRAFQWERIAARWEVMARDAKARGGK